MEDRNILLTCCLTFIFLIVMGLTIQSVGATIVDSEDFQSYNTSTDIITQSSEWSCMGGYTLPTCHLQSGTPSTTIGGHYVGNEGANKFLRVYAHGWDNNANRMFAGLNWNHQNGSIISTVGDAWYTISTRMRLVAYSDDYVNGTNNRYAHAGIGELYGIENKIYMGGDSTCDGDCQLALGHYTRGTPSWTWYSGSYNRYPTNSSTNCTLNDYAWHNIDLQMHLNISSLKIDEIVAYQDGNECFRWFPASSLTSNWIASQTFFQGLEVGAEGLYTFDVDNIILYANESVITSPYECSDNIDNDGDGFIDYPDDPSCTSATDNTEAPFDTTECNDGIDNDLDTYIDYPDDPSCTSLADNDESPADSSQQSESTCTPDQDCLRLDEFSYTDSIFLHGWEGTANDVYTTPIYTSNNKLFLENLGTPNINIITNITNPNNYQSVIVEYEFFLDTLYESESTVYSFYTFLEDIDGNTILQLRHDVTNSASTPYMDYDVYHFNGTAYLPLMNEILDEQQDSKIKHTFTFDQTLKTFTQAWTTVDGITTLTPDIEWTDVFASKIYSFTFYDGNVSTLKMEYAMDTLSIKGVTAGVSICDEWSLPYYLKESFNGFPIDCGWNTNMNLFFTGQYSLTNATSYYYQTLVLSEAIEDINTRYVTIGWDAEFDNINNGSGSTIIRLYDENNYRFLDVFYLSNLDFYYDDDGTGTLAQSSIPLNQSFEYKLVVDMQDDDFNIFFNGSQVVSNAGFTNSFYNLNQIKFIKVSSAYSDVVIDNLHIYASTDDGTPLIPDEDLIPTIINETTMCGLIYTTQPNCIEDSDCESGYCLVNHKCSKWNTNYCTEKGWVFGNKCFLAGTMDCALTSAGNLVIDNFFLFLVFLVIVMLVVYLTIMFRR